MKLALRLSILFSGIASAISLSGFFWVLAELFLAGWFAEVFNHAESFASKFGV
jgi:hypothetical protein